MAQTVPNATTRAIGMQFSIIQTLAVKEAVSITMARPVLIATQVATIQVPTVPYATAIILVIELIVNINIRLSANSNSEIIKPVFSGRPDYSKPFSDTCPVD
ncbi:MAG TPA: hypothetical protein VF359_08685 [Anaerolineales bacterium]